MILLECQAFDHFSVHQPRGFRRLSNNANNLPDLVMDESEMDGSDVLRGGSSNMPCGSQADKNAGLIMGTNNSSIVSKRSVERLYYPQPHFFQHFVRKPHRRSPTINRGYWLRMQAIERVVRNFLLGPSQRRKVIINLGCGYDPMPFQWLAKEPERCRDVRFVDVDHQDLMAAKTAIIRETPCLRELIEPLQIFKTGILMASEQYCGVACDLADLPRLDSLIRSLHGFTDATILCLAEVSITYMHPIAADALVAWSRNLSDNVTFGLLEQFLPDGAEHPFARTMLGHFNKLQTPLRSIHLYPDRNAQCHRFYHAGWRAVHFVSLWGLWSDQQFLNSSRRTKLDQVEPFDEWEEFALFAAHYFLLVAHLGSEQSQNIEPSDRGSRLHCGIQHLDLKAVEVPKPRGLRRHGAAWAIARNGSDRPASIAYIGGMTSQGRTSDMAVYKPTDSGANSWPVSPLAIRARQGHTITRLTDGNSVLIGGRASPAAAMQDCYLQTDSSWHQIPDLPSPRFRHAAAEVRLPGSISGILVFGGKSGPDRVENAILLWERTNGWRTARNIGCETKPRFGAACVALGDDFGLLFGGMGPNNLILQDIWRWKLSLVKDQTVHISFSPCQLDGDAGAQTCFARFGACTALVKSHVLVIGGIAASGYVPHDYEIQSLNICKVSGDEADTDLTLPVSRAEIGQDVAVPRPMLVGHATASCTDGTVLILGGGAVCFSFSTYWNLHFYILHDLAVSTCAGWIFSDKNQDFVTNMNEETSNMDGFHDEKSSELGVVQRTRFLPDQASLNLFEQSQPVIQEEVDLGPCRKLWNLNYLTKKIGSGRPVIVHEAQGRSMNFQRKDFRYVTKPFGDFVSEIERGSYHYLRSISPSDPTKRAANLEIDFPEIAADFRLPPEFPCLADRYHSSPLRITGNVAMWLHVDTMANVLCQITGSKRLILFPPVDLVKLDFPPGSTTSSLEIFQSGNADDVLPIPGTHPVQAVLRPGDVLFIPPLWAHTAAPLENISIAVNVFFRNLSKGYAAGKDVYGNRDLSAYENGRRDIARIVKAFDDLPTDLAQSYLLRLADELRDAAIKYGSGRK